jgi:hypothetical protein
MAAQLSLNRRADTSLRIAAKSDRRCAATLRFARFRDT